MTSKHQIRQKLLKKRNNLTPEQVDSLSSTILENFYSLNLLDRVREAFLYLPIRNEVNTWPLLQKFWDLKISTFLPHCDKNECGKMNFYLVSNPKELGKGIFNIPEPIPEICSLYKGGGPDLIVLPGVAFDQKGYRLGYGQGYFDRFLPELDSTKTRTIALAYDFQVLPSLPIDPWDKPVETIVTEKRIIQCRKR
ncbi:5-formyltetrahydrofolate cyclo-ligase [Desulfohalobiaceae bacterium Ax17]|jgi:5-formyltetrahydrofolate cyclo-ligase|uniref:5-formyltetrahydrofolate cyclo-ligase n=1 Tax=Desulfovulcanus ferrireducens TaxID=2831190 RepID=UPI00207BCFE0|nr:5-formyltetrahydrofolate cyclo-ligase [Desulfovulcanus ferrireducens]MBT8763946.1 5-formyltetrahydrofolate cyclo-ligase [Desulfovulcanus ferrireducens]